MPEFPKTGVQLVAEGENSFTAALQRGQDAVERFAKTTREAESSTSQSEKTSRKGASAIDQFAGSLLGAVAGGNLLSSALIGMKQAGDAAINTLMGLVRSGIETTARLQDVRLNLETLVAAEIKGADASMDMTEALATAGPVTDNLMKQLKELSLQSPFEYQQILSVFQMNKAFGQSTEMSLKLTAAITNLAAANKSIPGIMERLSYNFSQMALTGQITGRDIRDLAMAGLDLGKVLQMKLGMSIDEVNAKLKSGQMTFEQVSEAFVSYVGENFGTAAERASRTFNGLKSSFNDLAFFSSVDIFGKSLETITENMAAWFEQIRAFIEGGGLKPIGDALDWATGKFFQFSQSAIESAQWFAREYGDEIQAVANRAFGWGINISAQLAEGIIEGAATAITMALNYLSDMLSFWLAPGSPPRVAPDIDVWGMQAMGEFLRGMTEADFGTLSTISATLQRTIGSLVDMGLLSTEAGGELQSVLQEGLIQALSGNGDFAAVLEQISSSLGSYSDEVLLLAQRSLALQEATDAAVEAQERFRVAQEQLSSANSEMIERMNEYNALAKAGASPEVLKAKRAEWMAAKERQKLAKRELITSAKQVDETGKRVNEAKDEVDGIQRIIEALLDLARAREQAMGGGGRGGTQPGGTGGGRGGGEGEGGGRVLPGLSLPDASGLTRFGAGIDELVNKIRAKLTNPFQPFQDAINRLTGPEGAIGKLQTAWSEFSTVFSEYYAQYLRPIMDEFAAQLDRLVASGSLRTIGELLGVIVATPIIQFWAGLITILTGVFAIANVVIDGFRNLGLVVAEGQEKAKNLSTTWMQAYEILKFYLAGAIDGVTTAFENVNTTANQLRTIAMTKLNEILGEVATFFGDVNTAALQLKSIGLYMLESAFDGISTAVEGVVGWIGELVEAFAAISIPEWLIPGSPTPFELGLRGIQSAARSLRQELPALQTGFAMGATAQDARAAQMRAATPMPIVQETRSTAYNLTLQSSVRPTTVAQGFDAMRILTSRS